MGVSMRGKVIPRLAPIRGVKGIAFPLVNLYTTNRFMRQSVALFLSFQTLIASASDWPQWRGPKRDGISTETGLLKQWPAGGPPLAWRTNKIGAGISSVSVADGKIFIIGDRCEASYVMALAENSGKHLWATKLGRPGGGGGYPGPRCTPTVDGKLVYAIGQFGDLICVDATTGVDKWRKNLRQDFHGDMMS